MNGNRMAEVAEGDDKGLLRPATWWMSMGLLCAALVTPVLAVQVPLLTDYPNHLARCFVLAFGSHDPLLNRMFSVHWQIIPNIAVDLLLPALMWIWGPLTAGRIGLALCLLMPTTGTIALSYAYFQRRSFWQLAAVFPAFNVMFLMGFMNFELAMGVGLWGAAAWVAYRERKPWMTIAAGLVIGLVAFFFHLTGLCLYALLVGCYELFAIWNRGMGPWGRIQIAVRRIPVAAIPFLLPVGLYLRSPLGQLASPPVWASHSRKAWSLLLPFLDYSVVFDILVVAPVIGFLVFCMLTGKVRIAKPGALGAAILLLGYAILPTSLKGVWWADSRMMAMFGFVLFAAFLPSGLTRRTEAMVATAIAILFLAKIAFITDVWVHSQQDVRDTRQVVAQVQPGSRVLNVDVIESDNPAWFAAMPLGRRIPHLNPTYWHLGSFVLLDRRAFWQTIFAIDVQQPIRVREPYLEILDPRGTMPDYELLGPRPMSDRDKRRFPFLEAWEQKYDYVLLLNADGAGDLRNFLPDKLELLDRRGIAAIFRIKQSDDRGMAKP
jgi:hypothetical protein